jgi:hypothetical protein
MSNSSQLFVHTGGFLYGGLSLAQLADWVLDREEYWASLTVEDAASHLSGTIMLAKYEVDAGDRDEDSAKQLIREAALEPILQT